MSKWLVEWKSGRTDEVEVRGNRVSRNGKLQAWPEDWSRNPSFVSAVQIMSIDQGQIFNLHAENLLGLSNAAAQGSQQFGLGSGLAANGALNAMFAQQANQDKG